MGTPTMQFLSSGLLLSVLLHLGEAQFQHFFGPPAVGFGVGLVSVRRRFPVATSIVSRRSSRSYSHQYYFQDTPFGSNGYENQHYSIDPNSPEASQSPLHLPLLINGGQPFYSP